MTKTHEACGQEMTPSIFGNQDPTPAFRSQPILLCVRCEAWEPADGWIGPLPDGWNGERWTAGTRTADRRVH